MDKPTIVSKKPIAVDLKKGKEYYYCSCGISKNQPFCDGSHQGTSFKPVAFIAGTAKEYLCMCKHSKMPPFCDGSHKDLS